MNNITRWLPRFPRKYRGLLSPRDTAHAQITLPPTAQVKVYSRVKKGLKGGCAVGERGNGACAVGEIRSGGLERLGSRRLRMRNAPSVGRRSHRRSRGDRRHHTHELPTILFFAIKVTKYGLRIPNCESNVCCFFKPRYTAFG